MEIQKEMTIPLIGTGTPLKPFFTAASFGAHGRGFKSIFYSINTKMQISNNSTLKSLHVRCCLTIWTQPVSSVFTNCCVWQFLMLILIIKKTSVLAAWFQVYLLLR